MAVLQRRGVLPTDDGNRLLGIGGESPGDLLSRAHVRGIIYRGITARFPSIFSRVLIL
jgi:hypothetical protein